jgi:hypothetical protein
VVTVFGIYTCLLDGVAGVEEQGGIFLSAALFCRMVTRG